MPLWVVLPSGDSMPKSGSPLMVTMSSGASVMWGLEPPKPCAQCRRMTNVLNDYHGLQRGICTDCVRIAYAGLYPLWGDEA